MIRRSILYSLTCLMLVTSACRKEEGEQEIHCISESATTIEGVHFTEFDNDSYFVKALDLEQELCLFSRNKIVIQAKDVKEERYEIPIRDLMRVEVTPNDTILQTFDEFYRFSPSTRQLVLLHDTQYDLITNFSVLNGEGIVFFRAAKYGPSLEFYDFKKNANRQIGLAADLFPELMQGYGDMEAFLEDGMPRVLLVYNQTGSSSRTVGHVKVVSLLSGLTFRSRFLPQLSDIRLVKRNDHRTIAILADPIEPDYHRDIYLLDTGSGVPELKHRFSHYFRDEDHWTNGSHVMNIDSKYDDVEEVSLRNWETGHVLFQVNFNDHEFISQQRVYANAEEYLICYSTISKLARIVGRDNCIQHFLKDTQSFERILAATPEYVYALMEDGNVKRFDLKG